MNKIKSYFTNITLFVSIYAFVIAGCAQGEFFDQFTSSSTYSGYIVVSSSATAFTAPGAVAMFDSNGNFIRTLSDYYANSELATGLAIFGRTIFAAVEGSADRIELYIPTSTSMQGQYTAAGLTANPLRGAVADTSGNIYVVENNALQIEKFDSSGTRVGTPFITSGGGGCTMSSPFGLAYNPALNYLYQTNSTTTRLFIYNASTGSCVSNVSDADFGQASTGIAYHASTGKIIYGRVTDDTIWTADSSGLNQQIIYSGTRITDPYAVTVDTQGYVYIGASGPDTVEKFTFSGTTLTPVTSGPLIGPTIYTQNPTGIVVIP